VTRADVEDGGGPADLRVDGGNLRSLAVRGGAYLAGRHIAGVALRLVGAVVLTGLIGATNYGRYAGALAMVSVLGGICLVGTDIYLIRFAGEPGKRVEDQAFTFLLASTAAAVLLGWAASMGLGLWVHDGDYVVAFRVLLLTLPLNLCWVPAQARLERAFRYRALGGMELAGDAVFYGVAIGCCVVVDAGFWAPIAAQFAQQLFLLVTSAVAARYRARLVIDRRLLGAQLGYGVGVAAANWVQQLSGLVYPLVVGRFVGSAGVGQVALAMRLVDAAAFVKRSTGRLAQVALAKLQHDTAALARAHSEGMLYQVLAAGPFMAGGAIFGAALIGRFYGGSWGEVRDVLPWLLATTLIGTLFNLHSSALQVLRRNRPVVALRLLQLLFLVAAALVLVPRYGIVGYGMSEAVRLVAFVAVDRSLRPVFVPSYRRVLPWLAAWLPPLACPWVDARYWPLLFAGVVVVVATPAGRRDVRRLLAPVIAGRHRAVTPAAPAEELA
jgi:PST family polysaccharide transporter